MSNEGTRVVDEDMDGDGGEAKVTQTVDRPKSQWTKGKLIFLGTGGLILLGIFVAMLSPDSVTPNQSKLSSPSLPLDETVTGINSNPEYNAVVEDRNKLGAKLAEEKGKSFVPKLSDNAVCEDCDDIKTKLEKERLAREQAERELEALRRQKQAQANQDNKDAFVLPYYSDAATGQEFETKEHFEARQKVIDEQMTRLRDNILSPATPTGTLTFAAYKPTPVTPPATPCSGSSCKSSKGIKGLHAGDIVYATLETAVNSDVKTPVLAIVRGGPMDGARLLGQFTLQRDYVVLEFKNGTHNGKPVTMNSIALDPATTLGAVADDVDHHYLLKIGAVAGAAFLQGYGQAVQLAGQQIEYVTVPGSLQTVPVQTNELTDKQIAAIALGQVGETLSAEIKKAADRPTTVYVDRGTEIGLLLLEDAKIN